MHSYTLFSILLITPMICAQDLATSKKGLLEKRQLLQQLAAKQREEGKIRAAIESAQQKLAIEKEVFGPGSQEVVETWQFVAESNEELDEYAVALKARSEALSLQTKLSGANHWRTIERRVELESSEALIRLTRAQHMIRKQADRLKRDGHQAIDKEKWAESAALLQQAIEAYEQVFGANFASIAILRSDLAMTFLRIGKHAEAKGELERALAIREKAYGSQHPLLAASLENLGSMHRDRGDPAAARSYLEQALVIRKKVLGEQHPETASSLNSLGFCLFALGDRDGAHICYKQALAIRKQVLGEQHADTAMSLNNLGYSLYCLAAR